MKNDGVKRFQEWLKLPDHRAVVGCDFGPATARDLPAFQSDIGRFSSGVLDQNTWDALTTLMRDTWIPRLTPTSFSILPYGG